MPWPGRLVGVICWPYGENPGFVSSREGRCTGRKRWWVDGAKAGALIPGRRVSNPENVTSLTSCAGAVRQAKKSGRGGKVWAGAVAVWPPVVLGGEEVAERAPRRRHAATWLAPGQCNDRMSRPDRLQCVTMPGGAVGARSVGRTERRCVFGVFHSYAGVSKVVHNSNVEQYHGDWASYRSHGTLRELSCLTDHSLSTFSCPTLPVFDRASLTSPRCE